jgi:hypothetical protein
MESTLIHGLKPEDLQALFDGVFSRIASVEKAIQPKQPDDLLTRAQAAQLLSVDLSTLHNWNKSGKLRPLGLSGRVYYRRSDIEAALTPLNS